MHIPKYWAKSIQTAQSPSGQWYRLAVWGWSDLSQPDAEQKASGRALTLAQKVLAGTELDRYGYAERLLREESSGVLTNDAGKEIAVVTRNSYGALVVNAANAMFVDIDFPEEDKSVLGKRLLGMLGAAPPGQEERYVRQVTDWSEGHPDLGVRIYRTFGGLRCLITSEPFEPNQSDANEMMQALNSDPMYVRLCQAQSCFRARLTPKPWRCDVPNPPSRFPWEDAEAESRYRQWEQQYQHAMKNFAVCRFVKQLGPAHVHPDIEPVLTLHDQVTGSLENRALA